MGTLLPIGVQSFEDIRVSGYKYVDKTSLVYRLTHNHKHVFLSRPRRFGKSLLISTLEAYFLGRKELFEGLAIEGLEKDWVKYPVLHLDLNSRNYTSHQSLLEELGKHLERWEKIYGDEYRNRAVEERLEQIIRLAHEKTGQKVVILVDEYDKPLINTILQPELQDEVRNTLKAFYSVLKTCDAYIKFSLLTGVTRFSKVSIFSDLNNLKDISRLVDYYDICGITETELRTSFVPEVTQFAEEFSYTIEECFQLLKEHYDGYRFTDKVLRDGKMIDGIYNPFSLLNALNDRNFNSYWFETGTPTFLIEKLRSENYEPKEMDGIVVSDCVLSGAASGELNAIQYFFQTGYLTIKDYDRELEIYTLGYPNNEVKKGFLNSLVYYYTSPRASAGEFNIANFVLSLKSGDVEGFITRLQAFLSACPYEMLPGQERHLQNVIYMLSTLCGFYTEVESHTNKGRVDMTIKTDKYIYIFEFKYDHSASEALEQIKAKGYAEKYANDGREIICAGINYSSADRNINEWLSESLL